MPKKEEKIFIQIGQDIIELIGEELNKFENDRKENDIKHNQIIESLQAQKELKISAYKKLGLTDEEINAII